MLPQRVFCTYFNARYVAVYAFISNDVDKEMSSLLIQQVSTRTFAKIIVALFAPTQGLV